MALMKPGDPAPKFFSRPKNFTSAEIRIMSAAELMKLEESRMRKAGFDPDEFWSPESVSAAASLKSRIVSYGNCRDFELIVVEYKKSADKQASDEKIFKLYAEENVAPVEVEVPQTPSSNYPTNGGTTRQKSAVPSRATICQRNPQAYQCINGVPPSGVRSGAPSTIIARPVPPLPAYLVSARTPDEAARRAVNAYVTRYLAFRKSWEKADQDHIAALSRCGGDTECEKRLEAEAERGRAELIKENSAASQHLANDVNAIGERFAVSQAWRRRVLEGAWKTALAKL